MDFRSGKSCILIIAIITSMLLSILGAFAEEDIGRQGITVPSVMGNATASRGLEVAVANLQDYCNGMYFITKILCPDGKLTMVSMLSLEFTAPKTLFKANGAPS